jgi:Ring finger domain
MYHVDLTFVSGPRSMSSTMSTSRSSSGTGGDHHRDDDDNNNNNNSSDNNSAALRRYYSSCPSKSELVDAAAMRDTCCPVCLEEFYEMDRVSSCEDGCGAWFHRACLTEWLDRSDSCPCCRRDMVTAPRHQSRGCWHDLTVFLGYAPAR